MRPKVRRSSIFPPARRCRVGVDVVEFRKAENFYKAHRNRLGSFLSRAEIAYVKKSRRPAENLATLLAAKEAVWKALPLVWMGLSGFRNVRIIPGPVGRFSFSLCGDLGAVHPAGRRGKLSILKRKDSVIAQYLCS